MLQSAMNFWIMGEVQNVAQYYMKQNGLGQVEYHYGVLDNFLYHISDFLNKDHEVIGRFSGRIMNSGREE